MKFVKKWMELEKIIPELDNPDPENKHGMCSLISGH